MKQPDLFPKGSCQNGVMMNKVTTIALSETDF